MSENNDTLEYLRKATAALQEAKQRLRRYEDERHEPIAIVSMACRFPGGVESPEDLWRLLDEGRDAVTEVPASRWNIDAVFDPRPGVQGRTYSRWGGFLGDVDRFDPQFFGINPLEAQSCDPQQRLLLETTWEAIERAGLTSADLAGSATGVFLGIFGNDYQLEVMRDHRGIDAYSMMGTDHGLLSGRISYWLGLRGPNVPVDTACSSSAVALHLACQALRNGECDQALAGGVNLLLSPGPHIYLSRLQVLSPTGRSRTFAADADGLARAEGCGVMLLKRLSAAQRAGDEILAVIRGSSVNHDGRTNGYGAPSGPAQEEVLRRALSQARVDAATIDYVECHSTGTALGDPIEVQALGAVYGRGRAADRPLILGSIKTNIGHAEGAAGVAGVMKAVLSLQHQRIPRSLHFDRPSPNIPWDELPVRVAGEALPWERGAHPRRAGVSSFAMSGINAHLILEEAPAPTAARVAPEASSYLLPLSANTAPALAALARAYGEHLSSPDHDPRLPDVAYTASVLRAHRQHRLAITGQSRGEIAAALLGLARGEAPAGATAGQVPAEGRARLVLVFSDHVASWGHTGRQLAAEEPTFRAQLEACDAALRKHVSWSLLDELSAPEQRSRLHEKSVGAPALFAMQIALAKLLEAWGVIPDAVLGVGVGEVAAAHAAGALSLDEAARIAAWCGKVAGQASGGAREAVGRVSASPATTTLYSAATGATSGEPLDAAHWERVALAPASVDGAVDAVLRDGHRLFVEVGPAPTASSVAGCLAARREEGLFVSTLVPGRPDRKALLEALGALYTRGLEVSWKALHPSGGRNAALPTYPWQRERYWIEREPVTQGRRHAGLERPRSHPLLGEAFAPATQPEARYWERWLSVTALPYLADHRLRGEVVFPAAGYMEMALAAAAEVYGQERFTIDDLSFEWMLALTEGAERRVQVSLVDEGKHRATIDVLSRDEETGKWVRHVHATAREVAEELEQLTEPPESSTDRCPTELSATAHYARMAAREIHYGPAFQGVERIWVGVDEAVGRVRLTEAAGDYTSYQIHPVLLDACLQVCGALIADGAETFVPVEIARLRLHRRSWREAWVRATPGARTSDGGTAANLEVVDEEGHLLVEISGLSVQELGRTAAPDPLAGCAYSVTWRPKSLAVRAAAPAPITALAAGTPTWLVFDDAGGTGAAVSAELRERGEATIAVKAGPRFERHDRGSYTIDPAKPEDYQRLFREVISAEAAFRGVVHCWSLDVAPTAETTVESLLSDVRHGTVSALHVVQELVWQGFRDPPRLLLVTRGAQAVGEFAAEVAVAQAPLWGLGRTISMEQPDLACTRVDLDPNPEPGEAAALVRELLASDGEDQIARRGGERLVARLERGDLAPAEVPAFDGDGTYLITGGLGGMGLTAARWLVASGARHLLLVGRSNPSDEARAAIRALTEAGAEVRTWRADVARAAEVEGMLQYLDENMPRLRGVIHAAAVVDDRTLQEMGEERLTRVVRPKILGGWNLHAATRGLPLDFFVTYSSAAALLGSPGQGNYAAANAFLDALAHVRAALGLPGMSIQWGALTPSGPVATSENRGQRLAHRGIDTFTPDEGTEILSRLIQRPQGEIGVLRMSVRQWVEFYPSAASAPFLSRLRKAEERAGEAKATSGFIAVLRGMPPMDRRAALERHIAECLGRVLALAPEQFEVRAPFRGYGIDSLMSLEVRNRLEASLGLRLSAALLFTYPTIAALADHLLGELHLEATLLDESLDGSKSKDESAANDLSEAVTVAMLDARLTELEDYLK